MSESCIARARQIYNLSQWSEGYVEIADSGEVEMRCSPDTPPLSLPRLAQSLREQGIQLPVLLRFSEILHDRVNRLCQAFNEAASVLDYDGRYTAVYPIKVNQQRHVVEELIKAEPAASRGQIGLEAGSKPELLAVLALAPKGQGPVICNGYKDRAFIRLALLGKRLGHDVLIVVEKPSELTLVLDEAQRLGVQPAIGVRARLASIGRGNWQNTGGEKSKFGLSANQVLAVVERLRESGQLQALQLLHFHLGSQIANIRDIQTGLAECARFYTELRQMGVPVDTVDIGGGLGVDYEGSASRSSCSVNYTISEYATNVVRILGAACRDAGVPQPDIISESGRALTAHHAVLLTNITDCESPDEGLPEASASDPQPVMDLADCLKALSTGPVTRSRVEIYHDILHAMSDIHTGFTQGTISLSQRARGESHYLACCRALHKQLDPANRVQRDIIDELNEKLADKLFVNFSLFQSLPDVWGIDQVFPVLPVSGLDRPLRRRGLVRDMTCDSDGRIDRYVENQGIESTLLLPENGNDRDSLLGFFMVGAYQEILGDMHNLFGDTSSVDISSDGNGGYQIRHLSNGDTVSDVLRYVNFDPEALLDSFRRQLSEADLPDDESRALLLELEAGLGSYTYLEPAATKK